jgi:putative tributyrin esterase
MALLHVDFFSDALGMSTQMDVILPESTAGIGVSSVAGADKYPVLYLLHGMSDDHTSWQRRTSIERYAAEKGVAVVMPTTHLGWYTDMHLGYDYMTFISKELVAICREFFPGMSTRREDTFAAGLSMGGYGALKLGLAASETFSWVASLSGGLDVAEICEENAAKKEPEMIWYNIFGDGDKVRGSSNDLFAAAETLMASDKPKPEIYMWCGTEDFLYHQNVKMRDHLKKLGYSLTYEDSPGVHEWQYWDAKIQTVLDWLPLGTEGRK